MEWFEKAKYLRHNICKQWNLNTVISSLFISDWHIRNYITQCLIFNFNLKNSFAKSYVLRHTHARMCAGTHAHTHIFSRISWLEGEKEGNIHCIPLTESQCLPVMFLRPELVTTTRTTSEVAPWGPSRNFSVTYSMPLLRKWAPSLRASNAVTWKKDGCYITEINYLNTTFHDHAFQNTQGHHHCCCQCLY